MASVELDSALRSAGKIGGPNRTLTTPGRGKRRCRPKRSKAPVIATGIIGEFDLTEINPIPRPRGAMSLVQVRSPSGNTPRIFPPCRLVIASLIAERPRPLVTGKQCPRRRIGPNAILFIVDERVRKSMRRGTHAPISAGST